MSKVELDPIASGHNLSKINNNFQKIESELNNKVLYRDSPPGEPNHMKVDLDMNGHSILNANKISTNVLEVGGAPIIPGDSVIDPYYGAKEALRRTYAENGYTLVVGSFEEGGALTSATDVLLHKASGKAYTGSGPFPQDVVAGTDPTSGGFTDKSFVASSRAINASELGLLPGVGNGSGNAEKLNSLNGLPVDELIVDGYYEYTANVIISRPSGQFKLSGNGTLSGVNALISIEGSTTPFGQLTASDVRGGRTVTVADAAGINPGDTICIHNQNPSSFSQHRPIYTAGEYNTVLSKSGNVLTLKNRLMFNYTGLTNIKLFKMSLVKVIHDTVNIRTTGSSVFAMRVKFGDVVVVGGPNVEAIGTTACSAALVYDKCVSVSFDLGNVSNDTALTSTQYGIAFSNTWNAVGYVKSAHAYRHGISTGGDDQDCSIQCNNILIKDGSVISNDPASNIYAADFHGNTMKSYYKDCVIYGDVGLAGENTGCPGSTIYAQRANYPIALHEVYGGVIDISGVRLQLLPSFNFPELVGFQSSTLAGNVDAAFHIKADNMVIELNSGVARIFNILYNQSPTASGASTLSSDGIVFTGDSSGLVSVARLIQQAPGIRPASVKLKNIPQLLSTQSFLALTGTFTGCSVSLPAYTSPQVSLTIAAAGWLSSSGGSPAGYAELFFPSYPTPPAANAVVENAVWSDTIKISAHIEHVLANKVRAYTSTPRSADTVASATTKTVRIAVSYDNVTIP